MAYRKTRTLVDEEIEAGIAAAGSLIAYARLKGVTPSLVSQRLSRVRIARGESEPWNLSWDDKLRPQPARAQIQRLLDYEGSDGPAICRERWGAGPAYLMKRARA
ncbi:MULTISPECIES: hypothetical protein [unclassified Methylobacterium]|uniref:hypothetical protein n=1 Tax=unclassified Methylobacterium TaxID=2615210 RepID=UPI0011C1E1B0|nr:MULTISPECIES: hypothetical protein [unclassified Methylobacterium]QEE39823.1 hypothetical protein FVA80_13540 [Methylobacterium sp. WL1]TXN57333.1 hypothetical protein FV241_11770 [Methylobacterium sp. WL2]